MSDIFKKIWEFSTQEEPKQIQPEQATEKATYTLNNPFLSSYFNNDNKLKDEFSQLPTIYSCINSKARNIASLKKDLYRIGSDTPVVSGPVYDLVNTINPMISSYEFWYGLVLSLQIKGRCHVLQDESKTRGGIPGYLWLISPTNTKPWIVNGEWVGWKVKIGKTKEKTYENGEITVGKYFNLNNQIEGQSPLDCLKSVNNTQYNAIEYGKNFYKNGVTPSMVISTDHRPNKVEIAEMKENLIKSRQGVDKAHTPLLLSQAKAYTLSFTNKDLQYIETMQMTKKDICGVFGVPLSEIADRDEMNHATALSEDRKYWEKTLIPDSKIVIQSVNDILNQIGYEIRADYNSIKALNYSFLEMIEAAEKLYNMDVPFNMINERLGFGFDDVPNGDQTPSEKTRPVVTEGKSVSEINRQLELFKEDQPSTEDINKALRDAYCKKLDDEVRPIENTAAKKVSRYFFEQEKALLKYIFDNYKSATPTIKKTFDPDGLDDIFDDEALKKLFSSYVEDALKKGAESIEFDVNMNGSVQSGYIFNRLEKLESVNTTTKNDIKRILEKAIEEGSSEIQAAEEIETILRDTIKQSMRNAKSRSKTIARTEINGAYQDGRYEGMKEANPPQKMWITARDTEIRGSHRIDGETIPFDNVFSNGLRYPHDPMSTSAKEVINCRCQMVAVFVDPAEWR